MQYHRADAYEANPIVPVRVWKLRFLQTAHGISAQARWKVGREVFSSTFTSPLLAEGFTEHLHAAVHCGEHFDPATGLPPSLAQIYQPETPRSTITWYDLAVEYSAYKWPRLAAHSRASTIEALTDITCALLPQERPRPSDRSLRENLIRWAFTAAPNSTLAVPASAVKALVWAAARSPSLDEVDQPARLRTLLDTLARKQNGEPASCNYFTRRRAVLHNALRYAVVQGHLDINPLDRADLGWERPSTLRPRRGSDPRTVGNPCQVESMLTAVSYIGTRRGPHMVAFFACMYYAMLRPSEAIDLRRSQCELPEIGWGAITVEGAAPCVNRRYTDTGQPHDVRGLKHRAPGDKRTVPIPPRLVELLRSHLDRFDTAPDGRLFQTRTGKRLDATTYRLIWSRARDYGLPEADRRSPRLKRPFDLRHSGISLRCTAGVPSRQIAAWAGHSVEVLERVYSQTIEGFDTRWRAQIDDVINQ